tara:strand:+ start:140 stop:568 length:429 start_codon:yes stop_codon:yes gene_type:complete
MRITERRLRSIIRSVIKESEAVSVDKLPDVIDDDELRNLISGVYSIFGRGGDIDDEKSGYLSHLDESYAEGVENCSDMDIADYTGMGYKIKKEAFKILGFSDADIEKLCNYDSGSNDDYSYDYHGGVTVIPDIDAIEFRTDY